MVSLVHATWVAALSAVGVLVVLDGVLTAATNHASRTLRLWHWLSRRFRPHSEGVDQAEPAPEADESNEDVLRLRHEQLVPNLDVDYRWEPSTWQNKLNLIAIIHNRSPRDYVGTAEREVAHGAYESAGHVEISAGSSARLWIGDSVLRPPVALEFELDCEVDCGCEKSTRTGRHFFVKRRIDVPAKPVDLMLGQLGRAMSGETQAMRAQTYPPLWGSSNLAVLGPMNRSY